jgi:hypothetical protein
MTITGDAHDDRRRSLALAKIAPKYADIRARYRELTCALQGAAGAYDLWPEGACFNGH